MRTETDRVLSVWFSGCIIGRGGTKINEIRRLSGSKISIAKTAHDDTGERMFVISGLPELVHFLSRRR